MKMPKQTKSTTAKVREICRQYRNQFEKTPAGDLLQLLRHISQMEQKIFMESHRKVVYTQLNRQRQAVLKVSKPICNSIKRTSRRK